MKKNLTQNITRYDDKMKLKLDKQTVLAGIKGLCVGAPAAIVAYFIGGLIPAVFIGVVLTAGLLMLQITRIDGMSLYLYIFKALTFGMNAAARKKTYKTADSNPYRLTIKEMQNEKNK